MTTPAPATDAARLASVDAMRGFALFGILVVNIAAFASPYYGLGVGDPTYASTLDRAVAFAVSALFETKFYLLFSFLFGYSFTLQMRSAEKAGEPLVPRFLRRQAGLWAIGLAHAVLLFHGDILTTYAVLGVALLLVRNWSDRSALWTAALLILATAAFWAVAGLLQSMEPEASSASLASAVAATALDAYRGTPLSVIGQHLRELEGIWVITALLQAPCALAMFLIGLVAGRHQVFARFDDYRSLFRRLAVIGLLVGVPGAVYYGVTSVYAGDPSWQASGLVVDILTAPFLSAAYLALAAFVFHGRAGAGAVAVLAPAGRMALSNYVLQSLLCALLFHAYGLRLIGSVPPLGAVALTLLIFGAQLLLSRWWMNRHVYGPLEWLLRALTLWSVPRWRKSAPVPG